MLLLKRGMVSTIFLTLLLASTLTLGFNTQSVRASGTIYIRADGSIDPPDAPVSTSDHVSYTLTGNVTSDADGIVIEKDSIVVDGAGYTVQGLGIPQNGIDLSGRSNVTIKNTNIQNYVNGIWFDSCSGNGISGNNITNNEGVGIELSNSSGNSISGNNITNNYYGISLYSSSGNSISGNNITLNYNVNGVGLCNSSGNSISGNDITANGRIGIYLYIFSSYNSISENRITANNVGGIMLDFSSSYNSISGNEIANDWVGIYLDSASSLPESYPSSYNDIYGNNVTSNLYGIVVVGCPNNTIFHNNFINNSDPAAPPRASQVYSPNSANVLDGGYPSGGNYWSDYSGSDEYSGPYQNETGSDGIGDTPYAIYAIDADNRDNYPLMQPYVLVLGDLNGDGIVNILDAIQAASAFGSSPGHPNWNSQADLNNDNVIDIFDLIILAGNFEKTTV